MKYKFFWQINCIFYYSCYLQMRQGFFFSKNRHATFFLGMRKYRIGRSINHIFLLQCNCFLLKIDYNRLWYYVLYKIHVISNTLIDDRDRLSNNKYMCVLVWTLDGQKFQGKFFWATLKNFPIFRRFWEYWIRDGFWCKDGLEIFTFTKKVRNA